MLVHAKKMRLNKIHSYICERLRGTQKTMKTILHYREMSFSLGLMFHPRKYKD